MRQIREELLKIRTALTYPAGCICSVPRGLFPSRLSRRWRSTTRLQTPFRLIDTTLSFVTETSLSPSHRVIGLAINLSGTARSRFAQRPKSRTVGPSTDLKVKCADVSVCRNGAFYDRLQKHAVVPRVPDMRLFYLLATRGCM